MSVHYHLSESDFVAAQRLLMGRGLGRRMALIVGGVVLVASGLLLLKSVVAALIFLSLLPVLLLLIWIRVPRVWRRAYRAIPPEHRDVSIEYSADGLVFKTPVSQGSVRWQAYSHFIETEQLILLCQANRVVVPLPKQAFPADQLQHFRELVHAHVARERRSRGERADAGN